MNYVYLLKNLTTNKVYIGYTNNIKNRIQKHNSNSVKSTKNQGKWELIYCKMYKSEKDARKREIALKKQGRQKEFLLKNLKYSLK